MAALLLLTGCSGELVLDLYVQDVLDVVRGEEEYLFTTATVVMELPAMSTLSSCRGCLRAASGGRKTSAREAAAGIFPASSWMCRYP